MPEDSIIDGAFFKFLSLTYHNGDVSPVPGDFEGGSKGVWRVESVRKKCFYGRKTQVECLAKVS